MNLLFLLFFTTFYSLSYANNKTVQEQITLEKDSHNFYHTERRDKKSGKIHHPSLIVINYSLHSTIEESFTSFHNSKLSTHYIIDSDGSIYETIGNRPIKIHRHDTNGITINKDLIKKRAWHTGHGFWNSGHGEIEDINTHSIGIMFVNQGALPKNNPDHQIGNPNITTQWFDFTQEQLTAFITLTQALQQEYAIDDKDIVGYGEVRFNPTTKALSIGVAPGPKFFWKQAAENNVGIYHTLSEEELLQPCTPSIKDLQKSLYLWGYSVNITDELDHQTEQALKQLQIHHDPSYYDKDKKYNVCRSSAIIKNLLAQHYKKTK